MKSNYLTPSFEITQIDKADVMLTSVATDSWIEDRFIWSEWGKEV